MNEGAPAPILGAEIIPALVLENDRAEFAFLSQTYLFVASWGIAPVVGQFPTAQLRNPLGSGALAVFEELHYSQNSAAGVAQVDVFFANTDPGNLASGVGPPGMLDTRFRRSASSIGSPLLQSNTTSASVGLGPLNPAAGWVGAGRLFTPGINTQDKLAFPRPFILRPGSAVAAVGQQLSNQSAQFWAWGYVRALENAENPS